MKLIKYLEFSSQEHHQLNENSGENCDFDTFKDIMLELTDNYDEVSFTNEKEQGFYTLPFATLYKKVRNSCKYSKKEHTNKG